GRMDGPRQHKRPSEPGGRCLAKGIKALVHGIAAEFIEVGGENRADECRHAMLGLAHGQANRRLSRLEVAQQLAQTHEWRAADIGSGGGGGGEEVWGGGK